MPPPLAYPGEDRVYAAALGLLGVLLFRQRRTVASSLDSLALTLTTAALVASAVTFAPILFVSACV